MAKVKQKVSGCFRSEIYAKAYCRISSYLQTMANKGINPLIAIQMALNGEVGENWGESSYSVLPEYVREMALFAVNTGCRDQEVCKLRWQWEVRVSLPEINSLFIIPGAHTKNSEDRLVILNRIARTVVERQRGKHPEFVFSYKGHHLHRMLNRAWKNARKKAGLDVRVHDLKHTFGRRLRSAGVSFEDRQDLLGHKSARITTHYSSAEILNLWEAANKVCEEFRKPTLTFLRTAGSWGHEKVTNESVLRLVEPA